MVKFIKLEIPLTNMEYLGTVRKTNVHELMNTQYLVIADEGGRYTYTFNLSKCSAKKDSITKNFKVGEKIKLYSKKDKQQITCNLEQFMKLFKAKEFVEQPKQEVNEIVLEI